MPVQQTTLSIRPKPRGFHLITRDIEQALQQFGKVEAGLLHVFIQHTSASLTINEDADPSVRQDFESHFNHMVPENAPYYLHTDEGPDDMPAHLKASLLGSSVTLPVTDGRLNVGTWQGVYLCEHRNNAGARRLVLTLTS
ncbi:secondary thiamine-phosphate synthase enzyme YjbQ [Aliidiomarina maris]|uniref:Secondary thiamine-phosphate synthase enzyme n=1 Tax=Aliidiomarina maris TaxID=531312 RepID=A0A327X1M3_9GAMM|nr:secondary thiamine-phosphate synthase enzyme YjbQ [Aliidiomarina maris]RAJ98455.1 secondary thiamine-phosphate synthase enzyme [Aliidiomarina maris]RUO24732.1 hypothetical protein CWE07_06715 [Aliidiomarina maris]